MSNRAVCALLLLALGACGTPYAIRHRVGPSEDLAAIARGYGLSEAELRAFNQLSGEDRVRPGDVLFVPGTAVRRTAPSKPAPAAPAPAPEPAPNGPLAAPRVRAEPLPQAPAVPQPPPRPTPDAVPSPAVSGHGFRWPVSGPLLRAFSASGQAGRGIDIGVAQDSEVLAAAAGTVTYAGVPAPAYGPILIVAHARDRFTVYSNLSAVRVRAGEQVRSGQPLARSGGPGSGLGPHLHFELRRGKTPLDPLLYLPAR